jgi:hypothetical protein
MNNKSHFWYSVKLAKILSKDKAPMNHAIINGVDTIYTTMNSNKKEHWCNFDDMVYLGIGKYSHTKGTW